MHCCRSHNLNCLLATLGLLISCSQGVEYITTCGLRCSQGLQCRSKHVATRYHESGCHQQPSSMPSNIFEDLKILTVLKCMKERQCSLFLKVKGTLILNEHIRGVEICSSSTNYFQTQCITVKFNKQNYKEFIAQPVFVEYDCFSTSIAERSSVTIRTIPYYCGVDLQQEHRVEDCTDKDIGRNIPTCRVGKLDYVIEKKRKTLSVQVSDFLEDHAYHVRLCLKWLVCEDLRTSALIEVEDPKTVTLSYSHILPCLCIEGWSALPDATRIQVCPFKNYTEELWNDITYNHILQELAWKLSCPVDVDVTLCSMDENNEHCIDLQDSLYKAPFQVTYSRIDPHPKLCMKFTTDKGSWVRCPFAYGYLSAWNMSVTGQLNKLQLTLLAEDKAEFKVALCNRTSANKCDPIEEQYVTAGTVGAYSAVFNFPQEDCDSNICVQGWRTDVEYSACVQICGVFCEQNVTCAPPQFLWPMAITAILLITVTLVIFTGYLLFRALQRPNQKAFLYSSQLFRSIDIEVKGTSDF